MSERRGQVRLVVFDLGRVMIRLCGGWEHACRRAGVPFNAALELQQTKQQILHLFFLNETGQLDEAGWARGVAELSGLTPAQAAAVLDVWLDGPFPGWDALLDRLATTGVRTACLSNTNATHWRMMLGEHPDHLAQKLPLHRLDFRFASHLIGAHKPDPAIYRHVEAHTGVYPGAGAGAGAIVFFDDAAPNVEGARACGWHAHRIDPAADPVTQVEACLRGHGVI